MVLKEDNAATAGNIEPVLVPLRHQRSCCQHCRLANQRCAARCISQKPYYLLALLTMAAIAAAFKCANPALTSTSCAGWLMASCQRNTNETGTTAAMLGFSSDHVSSSCVRSSAASSRISSTSSNDSFTRCKSSAAVRWMQLQYQHYIKHSLLHQPIRCLNQPDKALSRKLLQQSGHIQLSNRLATAAAHAGSAAVRGMWAAASQLQVAAHAAVQPAAATTISSAPQHAQVQQQHGITYMGPAPQAVNGTRHAGSSSGSSSVPVVSFSTISPPALTGSDAATGGGGGISVGTSTPVVIYNPINVTTPLQQTTVQQVGGSAAGPGLSVGLLSGRLVDKLLVAAALKPRVTVVPVFLPLG